MSTPIVDSKISSDLKADPDAIFTNEALPQNTSVTSGVFKLGQTLGGVEVKLAFADAGQFNDTATIDVQTSATEAGTFVSQAKYTYAPDGGSATVVAGEAIGGLILPRELSDQMYTRVVVTTTDTQSLSFDAYLVMVNP